MINGVQDCRAPLYGDFDGCVSWEVDKRGKELQATGFKSQEQDSHCLKGVPSDQATLPQLTLLRKALKDQVLLNRPSIIY